MPVYKITSFPKLEGAAVSRHSTSAIWSHFADEEAEARAVKQRPCRPTVHIRAQMGTPLSYFRAPGSSPEQMRSLHHHHPPAPVSLSKHGLFWPLLPYLEIKGADQILPMSSLLLNMSCLWVPLGGRAASFQLSGWWACCWRPQAPAATSTAPGSGDCHPLIGADSWVLMHPPYLGTADGHMTRAYGSPATFLKDRQCYGAICAQRPCGIGRPPQPLPFSFPASPFLVLLEHLL